MKKKVAAVLTALMVLSIGTTAFAASSPTTTTSANGAEVKVEATVTAAESVERTTVETVTIGGEEVEPEITALSQTTFDEAVTTATNTLDAKNLENLPDSYKELKEAGSDKTVTAEVLSAVEISLPVDIPEEGVQLTIAIDGVKAGDMIVLLHKGADGWERIYPDKVKNGKVVATFTSLSPIAIVKYTVSTKNNSTKPADNTSTNTTNNTAEAGTTVTSPQTGESASVLPVVALICLAGIVVCGKKVKATV